IQAAPKLAAGSNVQISARADWLVCIDGCLPGGADLSLSLPVASGLPKPDEHWVTLFAETRQKLPADSPDWKLRAERVATGYRITAEAARAGAVWPKAVYFYAADS